MRFGPEDVTPPAEHDLKPAMATPYITQEQFDRTFPDVTSEVKLPPPCDTALVQGPQGSEYKLLSCDYEPDCAMYSPNQLIAAVLADRAAQQERKPHAEAEVQRLITAADKVITGRYLMRDFETVVRRILGVPAPKEKP